MRIQELLATMDARLSGRKPGMLNKLDAKDPSKLLAKAREMYGDDSAFSVNLHRECCDEAPHMKDKATWDVLTPTQKRNVAGRIHSKAVARLRATRKVEKERAKRL